MPIGTNSAEPAPAAAPNVASATRAGAHVVADRHRPTEPLGEALPHGDVAPAHRHRESSDPGVVDDPGHRDADPGDVEVELGALVDEPGGDGGDVVEHGVGPELPAARHTPQHVQPGRPEDPGLQRRATDVDGDDGEAVDGRLTSACSASRIDAERQRPGLVGVAAGVAGELDGESLGADQVDHRIEILAHELRARRRDVAGEPARRRRRTPTRRSPVRSR